MCKSGVVLALCLPCFLSGTVFGYEYEDDYSDTYYNEISDGQKVTQSPCQSQDLSRWDKLFIMLENSEMRQNMLLEQSENMFKVELKSIRKEIQKLSLSSNSACVQAVEHTCRCINENLKKNLDRTIDEFKEVAEKYQAKNNETLQQLIQLSRNQAARLTKLENDLRQGAIKSFPAHPKEQEASGVDGRKMERALQATTADLQRVYVQLAHLQKATSHRHLPSGCEEVLLFPVRSKHIFAEVRPSVAPSLRSFTICLWAKAAQSLNKTVLFSYGTKRNPQEFQLILARSSVLLTLGGETHLVEAQGIVTDGQWGHFCAAWSSEQGLASLWVNGKNVARSPGLAEGHVLPGDGLFLLGQERSRTGLFRNMESSVGFKGKMTGVNMWDHVVEAERIKEYANLEGTCDNRGNVIGWGVSEIVPHGGAQYLD